MFAGLWHQESEILAVQFSQESVALTQLGAAQGQVEGLHRKYAGRSGRIEYRPLHGADQGRVFEDGPVACFQQAGSFLESLAGLGRSSDALLKLLAGELNERALARPFQLGRHLVGWNQHPLEWQRVWGLGFLLRSSKVEEGRWVSLDRRSQSQNQYSRSTASHNQECARLELATYSHKGYSISLMTSD